MEGSNDKPSARRRGILTGLTELDRVLRGELTRVSSLRRGGLEISPGRLSLVIIGLAMIYGICMGTFTVFRINGGYDLRLMSPVKDVKEIPARGKDLIIVAAVDNVLHFRVFDRDGKMVVANDETRLTEKARQIEDLRAQLASLWPPHELGKSEKTRLTTAVTSIVGHPMNGPNPLQVVASMIKVPLLFYLTLLVTLPSLYVFNSLVGSRLMLGTVVRLLVASLGVMVAVLASLGPIVAFFSVSTASYPFILLFNVAVYTVAGVLGLAFLLQTMHRLSVVDSHPAPPTEIETALADESMSALDPLENRVLSRHVKTVFRLWVIVFALVGAQMGWVLRPFVGNPAAPFEWLRGRESNFFQAVFRTFVSLFS